jgi:hypothetical protein
MAEKQDEVRGHQPAKTCQQEEIDFLRSLSVSLTDRLRKLALRREQLRDRRECVDGPAEPNSAGSGSSTARGLGL